MRQVSAALQTALYNVNIQTVADLYRFEFAAGTRYWTPSPTTVTVDAQAYTPFAIGGAGGSPPEMQQQSGLSIDTMDLELAPDNTDLIGGTNMKLAALRGDFDRVRVRYARALFDAAGAVIGQIPLFIGRIIEVSPGSVIIKVTVKSAAEALARPIPNRNIQTQCPYQVYDPNTCKVNAASFTTAGLTVAAGSTITTINTQSSVNTGVGAWLVFTSGTLAGYRAVVREKVTATQLKLTAPLPVVPQTGWAFSASRGCDKRRFTCKNTFNNIARFGGFPDTIRPEGA